MSKIKDIYNNLQNKQIKCSMITGYKAIEINR